MNKNDRQVRMVLDKLTTARLKPPTVVSLLFAWHSLPLLTLMGIVGVLILVAVDVPSPVTMLVVGMLVGAALRDVGIARRAARLWPIQEELFDWQKIEALAQSMADKP
ncbi:MAG: hypothetical protein NTY19_04990 [Planctomycetota bacterium]|nr:hypothetical protein [Planctomycetota bacterium]